MSWPTPAAPNPASGPLAGLRVIEFAALGPVPFAGMLLSDMGADVVRIDRPTSGTAKQPPSLPEMFSASMQRGRRSISIDLKHRAATEIILDMVESAEVVLEGFRPGVMERLGIGPEVCLSTNPSLVYARMTGYGQTGPLGDSAGHDINYIAVSGVLAHVGTFERPVPPLSLVGDFGGGAMFLLVGVLAARSHAQHTGEGQVVDVSMIDGVANLMAPFYDMYQRGEWSEFRESNLADGGAPFYSVYETSDKQFLAVGAIEPHFYDRFLTLIGLDPAWTPDQYDRASWPAMKEKIAREISQHTREYWTRTFADTDACVSPVLSMREAPAHPHHRERGTFGLNDSGALQPAAAPRFQKTPSKFRPGSSVGGDSVEILSSLGIPPEEQERLLRAGVVENGASPA